MVVPNTDHGDLAGRLARGAPIAPAAGDATVDVLHTEHAQHRLGQLLDDLRGVDADVDGDIKDPDPLTAARQLALDLPAPHPRGTRNRGVPLCVKRLTRGCEDPLY